MAKYTDMFSKKPCAYYDDLSWAISQNYGGDDEMSWW